MALTPIEIIAAAFALLGILKALVVVVKKDVWYKKVVTPLYTNKFSGVVFGLLAVILLFFILKEVSIVKVFAVFAFLAALMGFTFISFLGRDILPIVRKLYESKLTADKLLYALAWVLLSLWVLYEVFFVP